VARNGPLRFAECVLIHSPIVRSDSEWARKYGAETSLACYLAMTHRALPLLEQRVCVQNKQT
jgi:hypothetical protein